MLKRARGLGCVSCKRRARDPWLGLMLIACCIVITLQIFNTVTIPVLPGVTTYTPEGQDVTTLRVTMAPKFPQQRYERVNNNSHVPPLLRDVGAFLPPRHEPLMVGIRRPRPGFLTIGIPSIPRPNTNTIYLYETVDSLVTNTREEQRQETVVLVLLSDQNATYNWMVARTLFHKHKQHFDSGFLQIINVSAQIYPDLKSVRKTFNDTPSRLTWRAKQNIDFGYLFLYSRTLSEFYLQLEDDVICASNFITDIKDFINTQNDTWFLLEFSKLGFIGKLFHSSDLLKISNFILSKYDVAPGDLLLGLLRQIYGQSRAIHHNTSLFQHIGKFSSLKNKLMPSIDRTFKDKGSVDLSINHVPKGDNPPAAIDTSLIAAAQNGPSTAYDNNSATFFWATQPKKNDYFTLVFHSPQNLDRIIVSTGFPNTKLDSLVDGVIDIAQNNKPLTPNRRRQIFCGNFHVLASFIDGEIDTKATGHRLPNNVSCIRIKITRNFKTWLLLRNIEIFIK